MADKMKKKHVYEQKNSFTKENHTRDFLDFLSEKKENLIRIKNYIYWYVVELMIIKHEFFLKLYPKGWKNLFRKEMEMAHISKNDRVLHIGCGPFPITAITIEKMTDASVVAIDNNHKAVELAKKYIKKRNIKNIKIELGNGTNYPAKDFDIIIITNAVVPRKQVLDNIFKTSNSNCKIICRETEHTKNSIKKYISFYEGIISKKIEDNVNWNSYIILKKN